MSGRVLATMYADDEVERVAILHKMRAQGWVLLTDVVTYDREHGLRRKMRFSFERGQA